MITTKRRRWFFRRRRFFSVPERWEDLPDRLKWYRYINRYDAERARLKLFRRIVPRFARLGLSNLDKAAILDALKWLDVSQPCSDPPLAVFRHGGEDYHFVKAEGANMTCAEFAAADDLYKKIVEQGSQKALNQLTAMLWREADADTPVALARGDARVKFHTLDEVDARIQRMGKIPMEMQQQAVLFFSGLKEWVNRVYGPYIFEPPTLDEEGNAIAEPDSGPNFGWWGILQAVAESGTFGDLYKVYQVNLHEVCIFLVRKKQESDMLKSSVSKSAPAPSHDDV